MKGDAGCIQQQILVCFIHSVDRATISMADGIKLRMLAKRVIEILRYDYTFMYLMKTIINFAIAF